MIQVVKSIELDYGHTLPLHYSFCSQIHGHRGKVQATIQGEVKKDTGSSLGMVEDFGIIKQIMMDTVHKTLDHGFAVWKDDKADRDFIEFRNKKFLITDEPPTAEYLAKWAYNVIFERLDPALTLVKVRWYETPNSWADYTPTSVLN